MICPAIQATSPSSNTDRARLRRIFFDVVMQYQFCARSTAVPSRSMLVAMVQVRVVRMLVRKGLMMMDV
jgi:hypothetical protein